MKLERSETGAASCPTTDELREFIIGDLGGEWLERIVSHVETCDTCSATCQALDGHADELIAGLRGIGDGEVAPEVPPALVEAACEVQSRSAGASELVVDPGRKIACSLADGPYRLGRFELLEELGCGSFGHVFKARDTELDRVVAVKVQRASAIDHGEEKGRFLREARSAAQLEHKHIVSLYETGETDEGVAYLVTEYIDGETVEERLGKGPVHFRDAARLVAKIARALSDAHAHGVIHRDIKPSNVMLDKDGEPHVLDFGLAKRDAGEVTVTPVGVVLGTPAYMSPELARGDAHGVDARSDVYSLGVVLYELLTGERPFRGIRRMLVLQVLEDDPRPPRRLDDKIPRDLETICLKTMEKSRARRYATAEDLALDLERFLAGEPIHARSLGAAERLWRWCRRYPLAAGLFVAILAGSVFGFWHLSRLSHELVESSALESAMQYAEMLEVVNNLYSSEVVKRVGDQGIKVTHDYAQREGAIPLPATLLTVLLEKISESESGMGGRHYSKHPFGFRPQLNQGGGPRDDYERDALTYLSAHPYESYQRIGEVDGRQALRYATARIMQVSCVECHNTHPDSMKTDWKVDDVRGVLEIIRPLDHDIARTRAGLQGSFVLVGVVSVFLLLLSVSVAVLGGRRRRAAILPAPGGEAS